MKIISSKENPIYKTAYKLTKKKYRDKTGCYLLEGVKPLQDALSMGIRVRNILICEGIECPGLFPDEMIAVLTGKLFSMLSDTEASQGVIAVVEKKDSDPLRFMETAGKKGSNVVVLDRLQDPGNIGAIIRTAEAAGYKGILLTSGSGDVYSPKAARAAAGSLFRMAVLYVKDGREAAAVLKEMGKRIVATDLSTELCYYDADLKHDVALVIGNEGQGVGTDLLEFADLKIRIPMAGSIESLNAAVAAGILMYQSCEDKF